MSEESTEKVLEKEDAKPEDFMKGLQEILGLFESAGDILEVKFLKIHEGALLPKYQSDGASGFDFHAPEDFILKRNKTSIIGTGLKLLSMPKDLEIQVRSRSGLAAKKSIMTLNSPGTIDNDYRGEIKIILRNFDSVDHEFKAGDRIAQGVLAPVFKGAIIFGQEDDELKTERGPGGLGSTDKKE
jgi:dUTP pyrophosphatase